MKKILLSVALTSAVAFSTVASAQDPKRADSYEARGTKESRNASTTQNYDVLKRERPEYDAYGKALTSFQVLPTLDVGMGYNDNIRTSQTNQLNDFFYQINPGVRAESQFSRHELNLFAGGNFTLYNNESKENTTGLFVGSDGRIDLSNDFNLVGGIGFRDANEVRSASNAQANGLSVDPINFRTFDLNAGLNKQFNRLELAVGGTRREINYTDGRNAAGSNLDQDDRDLEVYGVNGRAAYELAPDYKAFATTEWTDRIYRIQSANDRDSTGYKAGGGLEFALTNQVTGQAFAGYMNRNFQNGKDVSAPYYGGKLNWYPTPLLSFYGTADRDVQDSTFAGTTSRVVTDLGLNAAYEFRRNILVKPILGYSMGEYEGISGEENTTSAGSELEYLLNRNLSLVGSYRYVNRDASGTALNVLNYDQNIFAVFAKAKL
jgi:hypothetical protein